MRNYFINVKHELKLKKLYNSNNIAFNILNDVYLEIHFLYWITSAIFYLNALIIP